MNRNVKDRFLDFVTSGEIKYLTDRRLAADHGVLIAFTTRLGGVSEPPFDTLNFADYVGDNPGSVAENRRRAAAAWGTEPDCFIFAEQVHGSNIKVITADEAGGGTPFSGCDALITNKANTAVVILTADCVPIIIIASRSRLAAVVHAGWRGTLAGITGKVIDRLAREFSVAPALLRAYIGPSIRACSYRVDDDLRRRFKARFPSLVGEERSLDLATLNIAEMIDRGVNPENIDDCGLCTFCRPDLFYSYRRRRQTGRLAALALIKP